MEFEAKMVFIGDAGVGKTCILHQFIKHEFSDSITTSIGSTHFEKKFYLNSKNIKLYIWDTSGQEKYKSIASLYFRDAQIIALVYSIDDEDSMYQLEHWISEIKKSNQGEYVLLVIGNKIDLLDEDEEEEIDEIVKGVLEKYECLHLFSSAKEGVNIEEIFQMGVGQATKLGIIERFYRNQKKERTFRTTSIRTEERKKGCC